jgi:phosphate starvation-inducible PhoH-like protein
MKKDVGKKNYIPKKLEERYSPKTTNQNVYVCALNDVNTRMIIATGPAGTGKTLFACKKGIEMLMNGELNKLVITRPLVTVEEELGFLPGNIIKKMDPWTRPVFDIFLEYYSRNELEKMLFEGVIEISPLAFMRGRTFKKTFVIADEMQNSSPSQMQMLTTRIGKDSRLVITGDLKQSDRMEDNGLKDFVDKMRMYYKKHNTYKLIEMIRLTEEDVQRSKLVKQVVDIYNFDPSVNVNVNVDSVFIRRPKMLNFDEIYGPIQNRTKNT